MSQSVEAELAALEAEVKEPVAAEEDVDAALEALMDEMEDEPAAYPQEEEALPGEMPLVTTQPADAAAQEALVATQPTATQPAAEAHASQHTTVPASAPEAATQPAGAKKPAPMLKRKPMLSVAKKSAKGRTAPEEPEAKAAEVPAIREAAPIEQTAVQATAEAPQASEAAAATKPTATAKKPGAMPADAAHATLKVKAPTSKPKAIKPVTAGSCEGAGEQPAAKGPKRPCTAYFHFMQTKRAEVKAANLDLDNKGVVKRLGEMWKELGTNDKKEYEAMAAADKERFQAEMAAAGPLPAREKKPRAKSAYQLYCNSRMADVKAEHPKAGMPERSKLLAAEWAALSEEGKQPFLDQAKELKKQLKAAPAAATIRDEAAPKPQKKRKAPTRSGGGNKRSKGAAGKEVKGAAEEDEDEVLTDVPVAEGEEDEVDAEAERMSVDWEAHPAVCILSETRHGKFVVLREGLGFSKYGLVDAAVARQQRLGGGDGSCPVSLEMLTEYEAFQRSFKTEVHFHSDGGDLELEDLPSDSTLDSCLFLGLMREEKYVLNKKEKYDADLKVPLLATCQLVQRMVLAERRRLAGEIAALRKEVVHLRSAAPGAAVAAEP